LTIDSPKWTASKYGCDFGKKTIIELWGRKSEEDRNKDIDEEKENNSLFCYAITKIKPQSGFFFRTLVNI
jgi:hypothetical protein